MKFLKKSKALNGLYVLLLIFSILSCSKEDNEPEINNYGSIKGNVQLYDLHENKISNYNNLVVELIDSKNNKKTLSVDQDGNYQTDECEIGEILLSFTKPGFSGIKTIKTTCTKELQTIKNIKLTEDVPFPYTIKFLEFKDGWFSYSGSIDPNITGDYMITKFFFFSKKATVSCSDFNYYLTTGSSSNVSTENWNIRSSTNFKKQILLDNGFNYGDTVYITTYIITSMNAGNVVSFLNQTNTNLTVESFSFKNQSNTYSTILAKE
jgi:hypothetical protein